MNTSFASRVRAILALANMPVATMMGMLLWAGSATSGPLSNCIGWGPTGTLTCSTSPLEVTPWQYSVPGPIVSTGYRTGEGEALAAWATLANSYTGAGACGISLLSVGSEDQQWAADLPKNHRFEFDRFRHDYRKPATFQGCQLTPYYPGPTYGEPKSYYGLSAMVYGGRSPSCGPNWVQDEDDSVGTTFCYSREAIDDGTCTAGNPVQVSTGVKLHTESDYLGSGAEPLNFTRLYRSRWPYGVAPTSAGFSWTHSLDSRVVKVHLDAAHAVLRVVRSDNSIAVFALDPASATTAPVWLAKSGKDQITQTGPIDAPSGYVYKVFDTDAVEAYDGNGRLRSIQQRNGRTTTLSYSDASTPVAAYLSGSTLARPGLLVSAINSFGRKLNFVYDGADRLVQLLPPGAVKDSGAGSTSSPVRYAYAESVSLGAGVPAAGQLTSVTWQDGTVKRYHYEDGRFPAALTGVTDEAGVRLSTYAYDSEGRVSEESKVGGVDRLTFTYSGTSSQVGSFSGPNGSAAYITYFFQNTNGITRPTSVAAPCPLCGNTQKSSNYDAVGNVTKAIGHDGLVTFYAYDAKGRETERATFPASYQSATTRPALSLAAKVISTDWHAVWKLPTQTAEPSKISSYAYSSTGDLTGHSWTATTDSTGSARFSAVKIGNTYATGWAYNTNSLVASVVEQTDATETGRWAITYDALGDVTTIKDVPRNLTGRVTQYDAQGHVLTATTIDGDAISLTYTPRGFVSSRTEAGKINTYVQNAIGLTTEVHLPDGQVVSFEYSAVHRLTAVRLNGALLAKAELRDGVPSNPLLARTAELLERLLDATLRPVFAQAAAAGGTSFGSGVAPAMGLPGQPGVNASAILMGEDRPGNASPGGLLPRFNPGTRTLAEALTALCKCDPSGGYGQPKLTAVSMIHIIITGHTAPVYRNKSYFSEPVNQALVDDIISRSGGKPFMRQGSEDVYYVADMDRSVGFKRGTDGVFAPARDATLRVHADNCDNLLRVKNEVITMYPGRP